MIDTSDAREEKRDDRELLALLLLLERDLRTELRRKLRRIAAEADVASVDKSGDALAAASLETLFEHRAEAERRGAIGLLGRMPAAALVLPLIFAGPNRRHVERLSDRLGRAFVAKTLRWQDPVAAASKLRSRVDTIATTETVTAVELGRTRVEQATVIAGGSDEWVKVWNATFENTCSVCAGLHGQVARLGATWGGYSPGRVHPRCRCFTTYRRLH